MHIMYKSFPFPIDWLRTTTAKAGQDLSRKAGTHIAQHLSIWLVWINISNFLCKTTLFLTHIFYFYRYLSHTHTHTNTVKHIKKVDGLCGCYRGLTPKLIGAVIGTIGSEKVANKFGLNEANDDDVKDELELTDEERYKSFFGNTKLFFNHFCLLTFMYSYINLTAIGALKGT